MAPRTGLYSRSVAILKVGLPLIAVGMLAGLFLISDDGGRGELAFSPADLALLGQGMRVSEPVFSGVTRAQDRFRFTAVEVIPDAAPPTRAAIVELAGRVTLQDGRVIDLRADTGDLDLESQHLTLEGGVRLDTSDGNVFGADRVEIDLTTGGLAAVGGVAGDGPLGRIGAGRLEVSAPTGPDDVRTFLFRDNVRVVYDPAAAASAGEE